MATTYQNCRRGSAFLKLDQVMPKTKVLIICQKNWICIKSDMYKLTCFLDTTNWWGKWMSKEWGGGQEGVGSLFPVKINPKSLFPVKIFKECSHENPSENRHQITVPSENKTKIPVPRENKTSNPCSQWMVKSLFPVKIKSKSQFPEKIKSKSQFPVIGLAHPFSQWSTDKV